MLSGVLESLKGTQLSDPQDDNADKTVTLEELAEGYPSVLEAQVMIARKVVEELVGPIAGNWQMERAQAARANLLETLGGEEYGHKDAQKISDSKEFDEWLPTQSEGLQKLADSSDPRDASLVLDAYKEAKGIKKATAATKETEAAQREEKEKADKLHKSTMRTRRAVGPGDDDEPTAADLDKDFEEEAKKDD